MDGRVKIIPIFARAFARVYTSAVSNLIEAFDKFLKRGWKHSDQNSCQLLAAVTGLIGYSNVGDHVLSE